MRYDPDRGELKPFLAVAVRNAAISMRRKQLLHLEIEKRLSVADVPVEIELPDHLAQSNLATAIRALPAEQWAPLRLAYFEHLTHAQIAQRLQIPLGTVKSRIALAVRRLQTLLPVDEVCLETRR